MHAFFVLAISGVMFNSVDFLLLREIEGWFFLCLELGDLLGLFLFSHLLVLLEKSDLFVKKLDLSLVFLH